MTIHMKRMPSSSQANPAKRRVDRGSTVKLMSESGAKNVARDFLAEQSLKSTMKMFTILEFLAIVAIVNFKVTELF